MRDLEIFVLSQADPDSDDGPQSFLDHFRRLVSREHHEASALRLRDGSVAAAHLVVEGGRLFVEASLGVRTRPAAAPEGWNEARVKESASFHHLVEAVQASLDAGMIRPASPVPVAFGLWAAMHGLTSLFVAKPGLFGPEREVLIDHVLEMQIAGLARPRRAPRAGGGRRRLAGSGRRRRRGRAALPGRSESQGGRRPAPRSGAGRQPGRP